MRHEFETVGPVTVAATMRASDLTVTASEEAAQVVVDVAPRRGGDDVAAQTRVEMIGDRLEIVVPKSVSGLFRSGSVHVTATVPPGSSLEVETGSGDVRNYGRLARADVRSGSGGVTLAHADRVQLVSGSGDVVVESAQQVRGTSGSGDVRIGRVGERAELRTGSGDLSVDTATDLSLVTGSGDATIGSSTGTVTMSTGSGDLTIRRAVSGEVHAKAASGDITVGVASGTAALLDCSAVSGRVTSELTTGDAPGDGELGVVLRLRTVSGDILVRRG